MNLYIEHCRNYYPLNNSYYRLFLELSASGFLSLYTDSKYVKSHHYVCNQVIRRCQQEIAPTLHTTISFMQTRPLCVNPIFPRAVIL